MENTKWLKSLSDAALADEINCTKRLIAMGSHPEHNARELREAEAEYARRKADTKGR